MTNFHVHLATLANFLHLFRKLIFGGSDIHTYKQMRLTKSAQTLLLKYWHRIFIKYVDAVDWAV